MFCQHCGGSVEPDWKFCKSCGGQQSAGEVAEPKNSVRASVGKPAPAVLEFRTQAESDFLESLETVLWARDPKLDQPSDSRSFVGRNPFLYVITEPGTRADEISGGFHKYEVCVYCGTEFDDAAEDLGRTQLWGLVDDGNDVHGGTCLPCLISRLLKAKVWVSGPILEAGIDLSGVSDILVWTDRGGGHRLVTRSDEGDGSVCWLCDESVGPDAEDPVWWIDFDMYVHDSCLRNCGEMSSRVYPEFGADLLKLAL